MFCQTGFDAQGEVRLLGAHIAGQLSFDGAKLTNKDARALSADGLKVDQGMLCQTGFVAQGEVRLSGAHIAGQLGFNGAKLIDSTLNLEFPRFRGHLTACAVEARKDGVCRAENPTRIP